MRTTLLHLHCHFTSSSYSLEIQVWIAGARCPLKIGIGIVCLGAHARPAARTTGLATASTTNFCYASMTAIARRRTSRDHNAGPFHNLATTGSAAVMASHMDMDIIIEAPVSVKVGDVPRDAG